MTLVYHKFAVLPQEDLFSSLFFFVWFPCLMSKGLSTSCPWLDVYLLNPGRESLAPGCTWHIGRTSRESRSINTTEKRNITCGTVPPSALLLNIGLPRGTSVKESPSTDNSKALGRGVRMGVEEREQEGEGDHQFHPGS